jgi:hypothetical protein
MKEALTEAIERRSSLTFSDILVLVVTDNGAFPTIRSFMVVCNTILPKDLSNLKVFKLATF